MKIKHFLLLCGSFLFAIAVAYAAGLRSTWLNNEATNYLPLQSQHHKDQLTSSMRDALISALAKRSRNHESRIRALAVADAPYPKLEASQMDFESYLSDRNGSKLKSGMWNQVLNGFSLVANNHEQRIRCLEDGSCLPKPATYYCVGEYESTHKSCNKRKKIDDRGKFNLGCFYLLERKNGKEKRGLRSASLFGCGKEEKIRNPNVELEVLCHYIDSKGEMYYYPISPDYDDLKIDGREEDRMREMCKYEAPGLVPCGIYDTIDSCNRENTACERKETSSRRSCSSLSESSCKAETGCSRVKK